ncbi:MAG: TlpA family protein disulfide reductase [Bacteroidales bacterium]|nr:TlpA family protein disulfide reductase [Bacteroidales bacterium]
MLYKTFLAFVLVLLVLFSFARETTVTGKLTGAENLEIRLLTYSDLITYNEQVLDRIIIDSNGNFKFTIDLKETIISFLDVEFYSFILYLEPGGNYFISCDTISIDDQYRPYYKKEPLACRITTEKEPELNDLISGFNVLFDDFIINNFDNIYKRRQKSLISSFKKNMDERYKEIDYEYFQNYITYKIASVELAASSTVKPELFKKFFSEKPVLYSNTEYMYFFYQFFEHYLTTETKSISRADLIATINYQKSYPALIDTLGKDTLLRNEVIREMDMLEGLKELFYNQDYSGRNILDILEQVRVSSKFPEHRKIANNIIKSLTKLRKGTKSPDFKLPDLDTNLIELSQFRNKPVYLSFITTWSYGCLAEMKLMDGLYHKYKGQIKFITISLDKNIDIVKKYVNDKGYEWAFLYNGNGYDLLKDYDIKTFPLFVLINNEGEIFQYPAYKPSEIIETSFQALLSQE